MRQTFRELIAANKRNSALLVAGFCLFVAAVALLLTLGLVAWFGGVALSRHDWPAVAVAAAVATGVALLLSVLAYFQGDQLVLTVSGARPLEHQDDPELYNVVQEMTIAAGVPMPRVYLIRDAALNAFATGRDPQHASIAITSGLRAQLTRDELQGVIAHEMSHVRNYDIRLMLLLAVLVGTVVMLADFFWRVVWYTSPGDSSSRRDRDKGGGGNLLGMVLLVAAVLLAIVAPLLAQIIQLAVSRQREYLADASAVELTRYPQGLAGALRKIDADTHELQHVNRGTAHLFIANPVKKFADRADTLLASHPPIQERIRRLEALVH